MCFHVCPFWANEVIASSLCLEWTEYMGMHFKLESTSTGTDVADVKEAILVHLFVTLFSVHLNDGWLDRF